MFKLMGVLQSVDLVAGAWDLESFLTNLSSTLTNWFGLATTVLGIVAVAYATYQIVSGLMSHGKKQVNWGITIFLLLVGGALSVSGGFRFVQGIAEGGRKTIEDLGGGIIYLKHLL